MTICVKGQECLFGGIVSGEMRMNEAGRIVENVWREMPQRFPSIRMDVFMIMPNHFHGILVIDKGVLGKGAASSTPTFGMIMRAFKSSSAIGVNRVSGRHGMPVWQRNYYERVIRNDDELHRARQYIRDNPMKWDQDRENPVNEPASSIAGLQRGR